VKINFSTLIRTHLGFPSEWTGVCENGEPVKISYRMGKTKIFHNEKLCAILSLDQFDIGGYMDDDTLKKLLSDNGLI